MGFTTRRSTRALLRHFRVRATCVVLQPTFNTSISSCCLFNVWRVSAPLPTDLRNEIREELLHIAQQMPSTTSSVLKLHEDLDALAEEIVRTVTAQQNVIVVADTVLGPRGTVAEIDQSTTSQHRHELHRLPAKTVQEAQIFDSTQDRMRLLGQPQSIQE